ncbi:MAG: GH3 auxin-responsive promoter family protein [Verrucomicrobiota bacterium]
MNPTIDATARPPRTPWLQYAVMLGASVRTAHVARRLRPTLAVAQQQHAWRGLMARFAATEFGREHGLLRGLSYAEFRRRVAPRTYEDFAPWIERMKRGAAVVLWPGQCAYYAVSSGTTAGRTKYLPITSEMIAHFRQAGLDSLCFYAQRTRSARVFRGRHLFLGGSTSLAPLPDNGGFAAWGGDLSGITALHLPRWVERHLYEPGHAIAQLENWPAKLSAIAERTARRNVTMLAGIPSWLLIFAEQMRAHTGRATLREIWPNLECLVHGGVPIAPFTAELAAAVGRGVNFHEVYPASEAFIAAQDADALAGLRLLTDAGIFYEFLPMSRFDDTRLSQLAEAVVPLEEVMPGVDYALLLTTPAGLCRYVIGDVVRFISNEPPRLIYVGRTKLQLSAFGEHVIEKELTDAVAAVATRQGVSVANFHVAPRFVETQNGVSRGRHEWWLELKPGTPAPEPADLARELDGELQRLNDDYEAKRKGAGLDLPSIRLVPAGTFERWMRARGKWGGQSKMPRCRSDRAIADELALIVG